MVNSVGRRDRTNWRSWQLPGGSGGSGFCGEGGAKRAAGRHPRPFVRTPVEWRPGRPERQSGTTVRSVTAEAVDRAFVPRAHLGVADAEPVGGGQAPHADLALVRVAVHLVRGLAGLLQRVRLRHGRVHLAERDQPVGLPRLVVVGEVAADDPLEVHPQVAVVVLVHVAAGGGAGDDRAALLGDVDAGAERLPARVLEDDVRVLAAGQLADALTEAAPLVLVLGLLVGPELEPLGGAVDDQLGAHLAAQLGLLRARRPRRPGSRRR